jgi:hypothetical protein
MASTAINSLIRRSFQVFSVLRFNAREPKAGALVARLVVNEQKFGNHHIGMIPAHKDRANNTCSGFSQFVHPIRIL